MISQKFLWFENKVADDKSETFMIWKQSDCWNKILGSKPCV